MKLGSILMFSIEFMQLVISAYPSWMMWT